MFQFCRGVIWLLLWKFFFRLIFLTFALENQCLTPLKVFLICVCPAEGLVLLGDLLIHFLQLISREIEHSAMSFGKKLSPKKRGEFKVSEECTSTGIRGLSITSLEKMSGLRRASEEEAPLVPEGRRGSGTPGATPPGSPMEQEAGSQVPYSPGTEDIAEDSGDKKSHSWGCGARPKIFTRQSSREEKEKPRKSKDSKRDRKSKSDSPDKKVGRLSTSSQSSEPGSPVEEGSPGFDTGSRGSNKGSPKKSPSKGKVKLLTKLRFSPPAAELMAPPPLVCPPGSPETDLSAFAMPLIDSADSSMTDSGEHMSRPRSSSGSSALKGFLTGKSKNRNKSSEREEKEKEKKDKGDKEKKKGFFEEKEKEKKDRGDKEKKKGFFEAFRPRSKSDVSGMKRPLRKPTIQPDHSMDEGALQANHRANNGGSQELLTPMGQILEGQMLNVPDERNRHKSGPGAAASGSGFMNKFRTRSNSDSRPMRPVRKPLINQKSYSPPGSPRADRAGLSPLRLQSGEPRSAPPGVQRSSLPNDHTHAIIYKTDLLNRLSVDSDRMEIEDLDENEDQVYAKFMRAHKCYDLIPTSAKLVIFDTQLNVKKAFFALVYNGVRAAPLWDSTKQDYVGMLTITDFINILKRYYRKEHSRMDELEDHIIATWREVLSDRQKPFVSISPDSSLFDAVRKLIDNHVHRLPVIDENTGNAIYILTHKRILRFLHLYIKELPRPSFMSKSIKELGIGTFENVITASHDTPLIEALTLFAEHRISALPVVDNDSGQVINIYAKFDVINLAADKSYNNLEIPLKEALKNRTPDNDDSGPEKVASCKAGDSLQHVMEKIVKAEVHRLVVIDDSGGVEGIVSLSDLLDYIVVRPMGDQQSAASPPDPPAPSSTDNAPQSS